MRQRYWFWLESDDPLAKTLDGLGTRERNAWLVAIVRAGLSPGGYRDLIMAVEHLTAGNVALKPMPEPMPAPPPNVSELLDDALSQLGFGDDE
ncbi:MAG: hypothetical protein M0Z53_11880 [Thermaerobacter sp.]|nr:hypothetical protein [Thermaerobacter sp.]